MAQKRPTRRRGEIRYDQICPCGCKMLVKKTQDRWLRYVCRECGFAASVRRIFLDDASSAREHA